MASPNLETQASSGGVQRTRLLLNQLRSLGQVDRIFLPAKEPTQELRTELEAKPGKLWIAPTSAISQYRDGPIQSWLSAGRWRWKPHAQLINQVGDILHYDLVVSRYLSPACQLDLFRHPRLVIDVDDYDPDRLRQRIEHASPLKRLTLRRALRFSQQAHEQLLPRAAHCWISNPADRAHPGLSAATLLPNIPFSSPADPPEFPATSASTPPVFLMVGTMSYSANTDGLAAFLSHAWPLIRSAIPQAELHVAGGGLPRRLGNCWRRIPGLKLRGFVDDLAPLYARAAATLCPVLAGAGTNIKVLESAAYARVPVITRTAHRGFETSLPEAQACLVGDNMEQMAANCIDLCRNPEKARTLGLAAQHHVNRFHNPAIFAQAVAEGIAHAFAAPAPS